MGAAICHGRHFPEYMRILAFAGAVIARAERGIDEILYAEVDLASAAESDARQLFLRHRRPELYAQWLAERTSLSG